MAGPMLHRGLSGMAASTAPPTPMELRNLQSDELSLAGGAGGENHLSSQQQTAVLIELRGSITRGQEDPEKVLDQLLDSDIVTGKRTMLEDSTQ